ncbi:MAG TPA: hypothetical protein VH682_27090 [Gemmataceae bacterium]
MAFAALMVYEWNRWPDGSFLLGPFGLLWYYGFGCEGVALCAISLAMLFAFFLRPNSIMARVSLFGGMNWLFWGVMAQGIGC